MAAVFFCFKFIQSALSYCLQLIYIKKTVEILQNWELVSVWEIKDVKSSYKMQSTWQCSWRWIRSGCNCQISDGQHNPSSEWKQRCSCITFSYVLREWLTRRRRLSLWSATQRTLQAAREATISPKTEISAKGFWPFHGIFLLYRLCALEENLLTCPNSNAADGSNGPPYSEWWDCRMLSWGAVSIASH